MPLIIRGSFFSGVTVPSKTLGLDGSYSTRGRASLLILVSFPVIRSPGTASTVMSASAPSTSRPRYSSAMLKSISKALRSGMVMIVLLPYHSDPTLICWP